MAQMIRPQHVKATDPAYSSLADQLIAMMKESQQMFTPTNGQTDFTVNFEFKNDGKQLMVFVNGMKQEANVSYQELDSRTIRFAEPLYNTDTVVMRIQGSGGAGTTYVADHGHIYREIPTGTVDGINRVFRIGFFPMAGSELIFLNGILQQSPDDYQMVGDGQDIEFVSAPPIGDRILVNYDIKLG